MFSEFLDQPIVDPVFDAGWHQVGVYTQQVIGKLRSAVENFWLNVSEPVLMSFFAVGEDRWAGRGVARSSKFVSIREMIGRFERRNGAELLSRARQNLGAILHSDKPDSIASLRLAQGYSQEKLAALIHSSQAVVSRWERGGGNLETGTILALAEALKVDAGRIWAVAVDMYKKGRINGGT
ncbi:helix-turn-helix domain-containing protein [Stenotrophomonas sepilia]